MTIYKEMYLQLFNRVTDAIKEFQAAQAEAERIYLSADGVYEADKAGYDAAIDVNKDEDECESVDSK